MIIDIDPKVDYAFRHLFGRESTSPLLIDLLNSVLNPGPGHGIREVELLNPFNPKEALNDKLSILDIKARDQSGRQINVEMQMLLAAYFKSRIVYYLTKFHQQQLHQGEDYSVLKPTVAIVFLNDVLFPEDLHYHSRFRLREEERHFLLAEDLEVHTLELPKFNKTEQELTTRLDIWLYFLRHAEKMDSDALPKALQAPLIVRAAEELKMLTQTDIERERYEARRKAQLDHNSEIKARIEAEKRGEEIGVKIGMETATKISMIRQIHFCEQLLKQTQTPAEQLEPLTAEELTRLAEELQARVLGQG